MHSHEKPLDFPRMPKFTQPPHPLELESVECMRRGSSWICSLRSCLAAFVPPSLLVFQPILPACLDVYHRRTRGAVHATRPAVKDLRGHRHGKFRETWVKPRITPRDKATLRPKGYGRQASEKCNNQNAQWTNSLCTTHSPTTRHWSSTVNGNS